MCPLFENIKLKPRSDRYQFVIGHNIGYVIQQ